MQKHPLRLVRESFNWSIEDLARHSGLSRSTILRAEQGSSLNPTSRRLLCRTLGKSAEELGLSARKSHRLSVIQTNDPDVVERLAYVLRYPTKVDQATVDNLNKQLIAIELLERQAGVQTVENLARARLETATTLLREPMLPNLRNQLSSIAGETAALVGWLRWDSDDMNGAKRSFEVGRAAAKEANDHKLLAYLNGCTAIQPVYRENPLARVARLEESFLLEASPLVLAWLLANRADALAMLGQTQECLKTIDRVDTILSEEEKSQGISLRPRAPFPAFPTPFDIQGQIATSLLKAGEVEQAEARMESALQAFDPKLTKAAQWLLPTRAGIQIQQGNPEEAARLVSTALTGASQLEYRVSLEMAIEASRQLEPYQDCVAVQELNESIGIERSFGRRIILIAA